MVKAQNRATTGILVWHLWFEESVQWLESCTFRPKKCHTQVALDELGAITTCYKPLDLQNMLSAENAQNFLSQLATNHGTYKTCGALRTMRTFSHPTPCILPSDTASSLKAVCHRMSPEDSTEMCMVKAQNRATTGILVWHLWLEESVQWLESCTFRPKKCDTQIRNVRQVRHHDNFLQTRGLTEHAGC